MNAMEVMNEVLMSHNMVHLATIDLNGMPSVRGVDYAAEDGASCLYFATLKSSRKIMHIGNNENVAFVIDRDSPSWEELEVLKYFKGTGTASLVDDVKEMQKGFGLLMQKFPFLEDLPGDPIDFTVVRVDFKEVLVTDNNEDFGYTETINF